MGLFAALGALLAKPAVSTLVTAGSAALSSRAQSKNQEALANQGLDLGKLRREAQKNGFNPLTVLRATGGQGFKQDVSLGSGALASASFFNAFAGLGQNIAQAKQQQASLENILASTSNYTAQTRSLSTSAFGQVGARVSQGIDPTRTAIEVGGYQTTPANMTDAEIAEQRWGDLGGSLYGLTVLAGDVISSSASALQSVYDNSVNKPAGAFGPNRADLYREARLASPKLQTNLPPASTKRYSSTLTSAF